MWLWMALLLWVPVGGQVDPTKAVITLQPPWVNVFQGEPVTLQCEGTQQPGNSSTLWFLKGTVIQTLTSRYSIPAATVNDSGEYRCQTGLSAPSDPVQLEVCRDWLLLQVSRRVITEGEPLALRCHGWKSKLVYNVVFYRNGKAFKFSPRNAELTIPKTTMSHNGTYHCSGMGRHRYTSAPVSVTVKGSQSSTPVWFHILFYLAVGIIFVVNTVLCVTIYKELQKKKKWNLEISLVSEDGKKLNVYHEKDKHLEEVKCLKEEEQLQEGTERLKP